MRLRADRLDQRPENILPAQQAVGVEIEPGRTLDLDPASEVMSEGGIHLRLIGAAAIEATGSGDHRFRARIEPVLISKDLDRPSLSA